MRGRSSATGIVLLASLAALGAQARPAAQTGGTLTPEAERQAVEGLPPGRIRRPAAADALTAEQRTYLRGILAGPRGSVSGPLAVMMASPALGELAQRAMAYARFAGQEGFSSVPPRFNELAILMAGRTWSAEYIWNAHHRYAVRVGLDPDAVEAVRLGRRPGSMDAEVAAVYAFLDELLHERAVSDAALDAARRVLGGDREVVDLVGTLAIYQMSAMLTIVDRTSVGEGRAPLLPRLE